MRNFTVKDDVGIEDYIEVGDTYKVVSIDEVIEDDEKEIQIRFGRVKS